MLYRGVNKVKDSQNRGRLLPKGGRVEVYAFYDGNLRFDGKIRFGACRTNTARAHQMKSGLYEGCGVSTTRNENMAISFATRKNKVDGYVYVIDESLLALAKVWTYEFEDSEYPDQCEVTLMERNGGEIPDCVIKNKYFVYANGARQ